MNGIDPKWVFYLGILVTIESAIGQGAVKLTNVVPDAWAPFVVGWCSLLAFIGNVVMTALAGYSSKTAGPLVKPVVLVAVVFGALFAFAGDAHAQIKVRLPDPLRLNQAAAPTAPKAATSATDWLTKAINDLQNVKQEIVDGVIADINAADADAATLLNPADPTSFRDPIAHACYPAEVRFLQSLPVATAPTGQFILVQLFQKKRDFVAQIRAGLPPYLIIGCGGLLGDEAAIFMKSLGLIGVKVGINALVPGLGFAMPIL